MSCFTKCSQYNSLESCHALLSYKHYNMIPILCLGQIKNDLLIGRLKVQSLSLCHQHDVESNRNRNACINFISDLRMSSRGVTIHRTIDASRYRVSR